MGVTERSPRWLVTHLTSPSHKTDTMEANLAATFDAGSSFNTKLRDTLQGLLSANNERKSEIDALRGDHDTLKKDHDALVNTTERENDLRKNEIKSLERQQKDNQNRITDIAKLDGKLDSENSARKEEIKALDGWAKSENDSRKKEIADLKNFAETENDARKTLIANLENFAKSENDARKADIAALNARADAEASARDAEDKALSDRIDTEIRDRENAIAELTARTDGQNQERIDDISDLKTKMMQENAYLRSLSGKTLGVYFNAYRGKAYDGGGEENLTFNGTYCNNGGGLDVDTGIFTCPTGGTYLFMFHIATHDNKKALLSIRKNGEEIASIFDQNHKDNHKNSMAGQNIILDVKRGDEIVVYAYTGTWVADFPMNPYAHWVGLLLKPSQEEAEQLKKEAYESA